MGRKVIFQNSCTKDLFRKGHCYDSRFSNETNFASYDFLRIPHIKQNDVVFRLRTRLRLRDVILLLRLLALLALLPQPLRLLLLDRNLVLVLFLFLLRTIFYLYKYFI